MLIENKMEVKKLLFIFLFALFSCLLFSQNIEAIKYKRTAFLSNIFKANMSISGFDLSYELPVKSDVLLETQAGIGAGYKISSDFVFVYHLHEPSLYAGVALKYYYRANRRNLKMNYNNDFFWSFKMKYISKAIDGNDTTWQTAFLTTDWGIQKKLYNRFSYQFTIGLGFAYDIDRHTDDYFTVFPDVNFKIAYAF